MKENKMDSWALPIGRHDTEFHCSREPSVSGSVTAMRLWQNSKNARSLR